MRRLIRWADSERVFLSLVTAQLATAAGAFMINIIIARTLGPGPRGEIALILQLVYASVALTSLGRPQAVLITISPRRSPFLAAMRLAATPLAIGLILSLILTVFLSSSIPRRLLFIALTVQIVGGLAHAFIRAISILTSRPFPFLGIVAVSQSLLLGGGLWLLFTHNGTVVNWLFLYSIGAVAPAVAGFVLGYAFFPREVGMSGQEVQRAAKNGIRLFPGYFLEHVSGRTDRLLIPLLSSYAELGLYVVVVACLEVLLWPLRQYADSRIGKWKVEREQGTLRLKKILIRAALACITTSVMAGLLLNAMLVPIFGADYEPARRLIAVLSAVTAVRAFSMIVTALGTALNMPNIGNILNLACSSTSMVGYFALIPTYGAFGAGLASLGGYLFGMVIAGARWYRRPPHLK